MGEQDFVRELGYLGFTMRLKRINDALLQEGRKLYQSLNVDIEPNWYVVFTVLKKYESLSVTEIADKIMLAHPSVITIINKMMKAGYLNSAPCKDDSRRRVLELSEKAKQMLPTYEKIWAAGDKAIEDALSEMNGLEFLTFMEDKFMQSGFKERTLTAMDNE